jgi:NTE family protein
MSLDTIISAGLTHPPRPGNALVLMGGGARTAYQVGVLRALGAILRNARNAPQHFPFQILVGTSAGAINASFLAGQAANGLNAFGQLAQFWSDIRSSDVYRLNVPSWVRHNKVAAAFALSRQARLNGAILDTTPLIATLNKCISLDGIENALRQRTLEALAVTASSYSSGIHWTFCHTAQDDPFQGWTRPGRRAEFHTISIAHLMASSAIPFLFPATAISVDGRPEYFGDGSMRQVSPLSPAIHLGAQKVLVVGAGQPERSAIGVSSEATARGPTLASIAGHAMASVFHDTLQADVEQTQRVSQTLRRLPREDAAALPYRSVDVMAIQPTQSLDALAHQHVAELPVATRHALSGLGVLRGGGGALVSYLLFEPGFIQSLISMGESDAHARKADLLAFFNAN